VDRRIGQVLKGCHVTVLHGARTVRGLPISRGLRVAAGTAAGRPSGRLWLVMGGTGLRALAHHHVGAGRSLSASTQVLVAYPVRMTVQELARVRASGLAATSRSGAVGCYPGW